MRIQMAAVMGLGVCAWQFSAQWVCAQTEAQQASPQPMGPATQAAPEVAPLPQYQPAPVPAAQPVAVAPTSEPPQNPGWAEPRIGLELTLAGPNSLVGGGFAYQPIRWVELMAWGGYNHANASGTTINAYAEADIKVATGMLRARMWPLEKHSVVIDTGVGFTNYSMSANGRGTDISNLGDTIDYRRSGTPGLANIGVGYGYRSNSEFRIAVILGALVHTNKLKAGTVTSTGGFTDADREDLRIQLDDTSDKLTKVRAYMEVSVGFLF